MFWTPTRQHASSSVSDLPVPTAGAHMDLLQLETAFRHWVLGRARPELLLLDPDGGVDTSVSIGDALPRLRVSARPLRPAPAERLGLPGDATIGEAAAALLHARLDLQGPRCRTFRSAALYLVGLAELQLDALDTSLLQGAADVA